MRWFPQRQKRPAWRQAAGAGVVVLLVVVPLRWVLPTTEYYLAGGAGLLAFAIYLRLVTART
jgi:hypothetical protein